MFSHLFTFGIYLVVLVLIFFIVKTVFVTISLKKMAYKTYGVLQENISQEHFKFQNNSEKMLLAEDLYKTLFYRFFKITRDIISMQKLIFETYIK